MSDSDSVDVKWNAENMMDNVRSLQRVVQDIEQGSKQSLESDLLLFKGQLLAGPILLSLAAEIALKALLCWEKNEIPVKTHDLLNLYLSLSENTRELLEARMRKVSPYSIWADQPGMRNLNSEVQELFHAKMHPLRDVLCSHRDSHTHYRYLYEKPGGRFEIGEISHALKVIIDVYYEKRRNSAPM
ncbi:MAG: hypothetical protein OYM47_07710 [Gemmatimonadota bacterium]|nr:hypothetical protein [Gemmatimonadota bacterium]